MLRIKKDVDLKELEKFGFRYSEMYNAYEKEIDKGLNIVTIRIFLNNPYYAKHELVCESDVWYDLIFSDERVEWLVPDLIKAGLVEKEIL